MSFVSPPSTAKSGGDGATAAAARAAIASASTDAYDALARQTREGATRTATTVANRRRKRVSARDQGPSRPW